MTADVTLPGCSPEPLMSYLKALGVFRLVAEDAEHGDPGAKLAWKEGVAVLTSKFDREGLVAFFLDTFRPTPILAPWNGGSGFYGGGSEPVAALAASADARLAPYRGTIERVRSLVPKAKPKDEDKEDLLVRCRAELPDDVVPWLDVCFVLGEDGPSYFPLLGTGGNDGRLDFTNNYMQRVADILPVKTASVPEASRGWLAAALFADTITPLKDVAVGQFNPGGIGGANGVQGDFEAGSRVNPWDYVLMIEGALLFAGSVARRLGANAAGRAVFPFSVESVAVGYASATASEETTDGSRAELWLPLWGQAATLPEVRRLFAEGRAQLGRRQARNAVEFALAVNLLGVSRGVTAFTRYGFLKRNGLAFLAAPLGRVAVTPRPSARLLDDQPLTEWVQRLRDACRDKDKTPARYQTALRQIDRTMFEFANRSEAGEGADRRGLLEVLIAVGRAERTFAGGLAFCKDKYIRPLQGLSPEWLDQADDGSPEFRLAAAVAGIGAEKEVGPFRVFLEPTEAVGTGFKWDESSTSAVWSNRPVGANLAVVFRRRQMEAFRAGLDGVPIASPWPAPLADVLAFLRGEVVADKLRDLIWGLAAMDWSGVDRRIPEGPSEHAIPFEFGLPRLLVSPLSLTPSGNRWRLAPEATNHATKHDPDVFHAIAAGRPNATELAGRRLRSGGLTANGYRNRQTRLRSLAVVSPFLRSGQSDPLLASMLFPLSDRDLITIANDVLYPPESEE